MRWPQEVLEPSRFAQKGSTYRMRNTFDVGSSCLEVVGQIDCQSSWTFLFVLSVALSRVCEQGQQEDLSRRSQAPLAWFAPPAFSARVRPRLF